MQNNKQSQGRPLKFKTAKELEKKIKAYFDSCFELQWFDKPKRDKLGNKIHEGNKILTEPYQKLIELKTPTVTGLAVALGTNRRVLLDYEQNNHKFPHTNKKGEDLADLISGAKTEIEMHTEQKLFGGAPPAGVIFNLKNNWGWKDKSEVYQSEDQPIAPTTITIHQPPKSIMQMHKVKSNNIKQIGFNPVSRKMRVRFKNGLVDDYHAITKDLFLEVLEAESKSKFLATRIENKFICDRGSHPKDIKNTSIKKKL